MNGTSSRPRGSIRTSGQSLHGLMYAATLGIAIVGAWSVSLEADAQERGHSLRCPVGGMCRWTAGPQTAARTLANTSLDAQRQRDAAVVF